MSANGLSKVPKLPTGASSLDPTGDFRSQDSLGYSSPDKKNPVAATEHSCNLLRQRTS